MNGLDYRSYRAGVAAGCAKRFEWERAAYARGVSSAHAMLTAVLEPPERGYAGAPRLIGTAPERPRMLAQLYPEPAPLGDLDRCDPFESVTLSTVAFRTKRLACEIAGNVFYWFTWEPIE